MECRLPLVEYFTRRHYGLFNATSTLLAGTGSVVRAPANPSVRPSLSLICFVVWILLTRAPSVTGSPICVLLLVGANVTRCPWKYPLHGRTNLRSKRLASSNFEPHRDLTALQFGQEFPRIFLSPICLHTCRQPRLLYSATWAKLMTCAVYSVRRWLQNAVCLVGVWNLLLIRAAFRAAQLMMVLGPMFAPTWDSSAELQVRICPGIERCACYRCLGQRASFDVSRGVVPHVHC